MASAEPAENLTPLLDEQAMKRQLALLGKNGSTRTRCFISKHDPRYNDSSYGHLPRTGQLNLKVIEGWQRQGLGVYLVVNEGGDKDADITSALAFFTDWDGMPYAEQVKRLERAKAQGLPTPTFVVRTSPRDDASLHLYWVLDQPTEQLALWRFMQWRLIQLLDSDSAIENPSRVMRLVGCHYAKGAEKLVGHSFIVDELGGGERVTLAAFCDAVAEAEECAELVALDAIPDSFFGTSEKATALQQRLVDEMTAAWGEEASTALLDRMQSRTRTRKTVEAKQERKAGKANEKAEAKADAADKVRTEKCAAYWWAIDAERRHTLEDLKSALAAIPARVPGAKTYTTYRNILWGLMDACCEQVDGLSDPEGTAIDLMGEHSPDGWDVDQVGGSGDGSVKFKTFWWHAVENGWRPAGEEWKKAKTDFDPDHQAMLMAYAQMQIEIRIEAGASPAEIQEFINCQIELNGYGLSKFADAVRQEQQRQEHLEDALRILFAEGKRPQIDIADYLPAEWVEQCHVLRHGLKFPDEAIVLSVLAGLAGVLPPGLRVRGYSMKEGLALWLLLVGVSGTAKSVLLKTLVMEPIERHVFPLLDRFNAAREKQWQEEYENTPQNKKKPPRPRPRRILFTAPTSQGIRADLAANGASTPIILARDELAGWLKDMAAPAAGGSDVEFYLSSYDESFSSDVFADDTKSREVRSGKLSVIGGIQPDVLEKHLPEGLANGFFSRPLCVPLPRLKRELVRDPHKGALVDSIGEMYAAMLPDNQQADGCAPWSLAGMPALMLSEQAEVTFEKFFDELETISMDSQSESIAALWAKAPGQLLRLSAALQILRLYTRMETMSELEDVSAAAKADLTDFHSYLPISNATLQLAMQLLMVGKTTSEDVHRRAEDPRFALGARFREVALRLQGKQGGPVKLRDIAKSGWSGKDRPSADELRGIAVAGAAQRVMIYDPNASTVVIR